MNVAYIQIPKPSLTGPPCDARYTSVNELFKQSRNFTAPETCISALQALHPERNLRRRFNLNLLGFDRAHADDARTLC
jgi:hypothetical protein